MEFDLSFGASGGLCFVIRALPGYLHLYMFFLNINLMRRYFTFYVYYVNYR